MCVLTIWHTNGKQAKLREREGGLCCNSVWEKERAFDWHKTDHNTILMQRNDNKYVIVGTYCVSSMFCKHVNTAVLKYSDRCCSINTHRIQRIRHLHILFGLLLCLQYACATSTTCGSQFEDIYSKAVEASTVFEGTLVGRSYDVTTPPGGDDSYYYATFDVIKTFKGTLPRHRRQYSPVVVGVFGPRDPVRCTVPVLEGSQYIVFLNSTINPHNANYYLISHFPENSTKSTKRQIRKVLCEDPDCGTYQISIISCV